MRARIRKKLLPLLEKQFQPAIVKHLATLAELAREDEAFLEAVAEERAGVLVQKNDERSRIGVDDLFQAHTKRAFNTEVTSALSKRIVRRIVEGIKPRDGQLGAAHVEAVLQLARRGRSGSSLLLPGGVEVRRLRDTLVFQAIENAGRRNSQSAPQKYEYQVNLARGGAEVHVAEMGCVFASG